MDRLKYPWEEWNPLEEGNPWEEALEPPWERRESTFDELWARLSRRQREVSRLAALGETNREIGQRLGISPKTVDAHLFRVYCGLRVRGRRELKDRMWREGPFRRP